MQLIATVSQEFVMNASPSALLRLNTTPRYIETSLMMLWPSQAWAIASYCTGEVPTRLHIEEPRVSRRAMTAHGAGNTTRTPTRAPRSKRLIIPVLVLFARKAHGLTRLSLVATFACVEPVLIHSRQVNVNGVPFAVQRAPVS